MKLMDRKRFLFAAAAALTALGLSSAQAQTVLKLGDIYAKNHSNSMAADRFAELVAKKTGGEVKIEVYVDSSLGNERELAESVVAGSIDIAPSGQSGIGRFVPATQVLELPYLYRDLDHMQRVATAVAPEVDKMFAEKGLRNLGYLFLGPRSIASKRPIRTLADMKGLRLRVPESPLYVGLARALGASPTPVPFPEVYTSLETGVADAAEGEPATLFTTKWYEPTKRVSLTKHIWHYRFIVMNGEKFKSLSEKNRKALLEAAQEAQAYQATLVPEFNQKALDTMKAQGVDIVETQDLEKFAEALLAFNTSHAKSLGPAAEQLLERVRAVK
jgi:tripartite ATP-independent transporter DctP family solute receptor